MMLECLKKRASPVIRPVSDALLFLFVSVTPVWAADATATAANNSASGSSNMTEMQQLMQIAGKIIAGALILGVVLSVLALVKAGYAYAVEDNPHQARDRAKRALIGVVLMLISVPFVAFIWYNLLEDYGYTMPSFK